MLPDICKQAAATTMAATAVSGTQSKRSLSGKYNLNKTLSDPISPFLKAAGYSWTTRKVRPESCSARRTFVQSIDSVQAADAVGLTLTINVQDDALFGHGSTWLGDADYELSFSKVRMRRAERRFPLSLPPRLFGLHQHFCAAKGLFLQTSKYALIGDDAIEFDSLLDDNGSVHSSGVMPNDNTLRVRMVHEASEDGGLLVSTTITDADGTVVVSIKRVLDACP